MFEAWDGIISPATKEKNLENLQHMFFIERKKS